jgi:3alpha(or 20beta)-hydroxysteroid dehydrogenase
MWHVHRAGPARFSCQCRLRSWRIRASFGCEDRVDHGASAGQGEAESRLFAAHGAHVVAADIDVDRGRQVAAELGDRAIFVRLDVTSPADWASAIERTVDQFGSLDILVNNAAGTAGRTGPLEHMSFADYNFVLSLNLTGAWLGTQAAIAPMLKAGGGSIINISSIVGLVAFPGMGAYSAAKWGLRGLTKTAAIEPAEDDIRVNSIHPGFIDTPGSSATGLPETIAETNRFRGASVPLRRAGRPNDIAHAALFLASDESRYCTGMEMAVDSGATVGPMDLPVRVSSVAPAPV